MIITKIFTFEAAHKLINYKGVCAKLHGHSYILHVSLKGTINNSGMVLDFKDLRDIVNINIINKLDHSYINEVIQQPTAENIILWIWDQLSTKIPLFELKLYETATSYVTCRGKDENK